MTLLARTRPWVLLVVPLVLGLLVGAVVPAFQTPLYRATARVFVATAASSASAANTAAEATARRLAPLAEQSYVLHAVRERLDLPLRSSQIADELTATVQPGTSVITVAVLDPTPVRAAAIADAVATRLVSAVGELDTVGVDQAPARATVVNTAVVSAAPVLPDRGLWLLVGGVFGLLLGLVLLLLGRRQRRGVVRRADEVERATRAPVLAEVPSAATAADLAALAEELSGGLVIGVTGPATAEPELSVELALAFAATGRSVALVDGDLRRDGLRDRVGATAGPGLVEVLGGRSDVLDVVQTATRDGRAFAFVPAGRPSERAGVLLTGPRTRPTLHRLKEEADAVVVALPPAFGTADAVLLGLHLDGTLLVARRGATTSGQLVSAAQEVRGIGAHLFGTVLVGGRRATTTADGVAELERTAGPLELESGDSTDR